MRRLIITLVLLLVISGNCFGSVQFALSDVSDYRWKLNAIDGYAGVASDWSVSGVAANGDVIALVNGPSGISALPATVDFQIATAPLVGSNRAWAKPSVTLNGAALPSSVVQGSWAFSGPSIESPVSVQLDTSPGARPGTFIGANGRVENVSVTFDVDFRVFASANDTTPAYQLTGSGTGKADAGFSTGMPIADFIVQTDTQYYDLTVADSGVVPEPASILVWSLFAIGGLVAYRRRR